MGFKTQWRGQRDTYRWRLRALVVASLLLHVPLSPLGALFGLVALLSNPNAEIPVADLNAITAIPVELEGDDSAQQAAEPAPAEVEEEPGDLDEEILKELEDWDEEPLTLPDEEDAGITDAAVVEEDADLDAGAADARAEELDAGLEAGPPTVSDPVALTGSAGSVVDANANVRLLVYADRIRKHPVGDRVKALLRNTYQWQDFFGAGGIDPLRDVDRILIAGPQLRNSSEVVAVLRYNVGRKKIRGAVEKLVKRDRAGGGWLDAGVPAATARADGAERVFVMPAPRIIVVAPPSARQHALSLPSSIKFPPPRGNEAVNVYLVTPWRALMGLKFSVPKSIKWARISITPTPNGGAVARAVGEDESAEAAKRNAAHLKRTLNGFRGMSIFKMSFIDRVDFHSQGPMIYGEVSATKNQLAFLLEMALQQQKKYTQAIAKRKAAREKAAKDKAAKAKAAREKAAKAKAAREKAAKAKAAREKAAKDKAAKDKAARDKAAKDKAARDEAAKDKAAGDRSDE